MRPRARPRPCRLALAMALLATSLGWLLPAPALAAPARDVEADLLRRLNQARVHAGVAPLVVDRGRAALRANGRR